MGKGTTPLTPRHRIFDVATDLADGGHPEGRIWEFRERALIAFADEIERAVLKGAFDRLTHYVGRAASGSEYAEGFKDGMLYCTGLLDDAIKNKDIGKTKQKSEPE